MNAVLTFAAKIVIALLFSVLICSLLKTCTLFFADANI